MTEKRPTPLGWLVIALGCYFLYTHYVKTPIHWPRQLPQLPSLPGQTPVKPTAVPSRRPMQPPTEAPTAPEPEPTTPSEAAPATPQRPVAPTNSFAPTISTLPLRLPASPVHPAVHDTRINAILDKQEQFPTFEGYRRLAALYIEHGLFEQAANTFRTEASMYRRKGLTDAAIIEENKAASYATTVQLFVDRAPTSQELDRLYTGAPLEPMVGCYLGAFIDRDDQLQQTYIDENWQTHRTLEEFVRYVGKPHASLFMYLHYGQKFPQKWIEDCKSHNVIPHIAWEPSNLNEVQDNAYLRSFAAACRAVEWPIFFRFASEMNGFWTPYHNNPKLYREKFRLVHRVLHQNAPLIATIWCVNNPPLGNIEAYYPGDDGCDWVGVNLYSVPFHENKTNQPAFRESPLALLDPIYQKYARRKPIAICEYGASHMAVVDKLARPDFAIDKMALLYSTLPRLYPRVKLVDWFDMNTIRYPSPGKTLNDYTLTDDRAVARAYAGQISPAYYLSEREHLSNARPPLPNLVESGQKVGGHVRFSIWVKTYVARPTVLLKIGNRIVYAGRQPGAHIVNLDLTRAASGEQPVTTYVYDNQNRFISAETTKVNVVPYQT
ncbi:MAG: hypothetical protein JO316_12640 [Abitibacteriaceae bacterium]|nr:hypothetical protein [Abditibacteriaceae bacterium]